MNTRSTHPLTQHDIVTLRDMPDRSFRVTYVWDLHHATVRETLTDGDEGQPFWITASEVMCRVASHEVLLRTSIRRNAITAQYPTVA